MAILVSPDKPVIPLSTVHHKNCRTMAIGESVNKVKNIPVAEIIITVGSSHHKMYLMYAKPSIGIPLSAPKDIKGMSDSKLNNITGIKTIVILAKYLESTNLSVDTFLL